MMKICVGAAAGHLVTMFVAGWAFLIVIGKGAVQMPKRHKWTGLQEERPLGKFDWEVLMEDPAIDENLAEDLLGRFDIFLTTKTQAAQTSGWETSVRLLSLRADGFPALGIAPFGTVRKPLRFLIQGTRTQLSSLQGRVQINYGDTGPPLVDASILQRNLPSVLRSVAKQFALDRFPDKSDEEIAIKGASRYISRGLDALGYFTHKLICWQAKFTYTPLTPSKVATTHYKTFVQSAYFGRFDVLDPTFTGEYKTLASRFNVVHTSTDDQLIDLDSVDAKEPRIDEDWFLARDWANRTLADRANLATHYVCPQETVLRPQGYSNHCVHLGSFRQPANPKAMSPADRFALQCAALYPIGALVVARRHLDVINTDDNSREVVSKWVIRECLPDGWGQQRFLSDALGEQVHELCIKNINEQTVGPREILKAAGVLSGQVRLHPELRPDETPPLGGGWDGIQRVSANGVINNRLLLITGEVSKPAARYISLALGCAKGLSLLRRGEAPFGLWVLSASVLTFGKIASQTFFMLTLVFTSISANGRLDLTAALPLLIICLLNHGARKAGSSASYISLITIAFISQLVRIVVLRHTRMIFDALAWATFIAATSSLSKNFTTEVELALQLMMLAYLGLSQSHTSQRFQDYSLIASSILVLVASFGVIAHLSTIHITRLKYKLASWLSFAAFVLMTLLLPLSSESHEWPYSSAMGFALSEAIRNWRLVAFWALFVPAAITFGVRKVIVPPAPAACGWQKTRYILGRKYFHAVMAIMASSTILSTDHLFGCLAWLIATCLYVIVEVCRVNNLLSFGEWCESVLMPYADERDKRGFIQTPFFLILGTSVTIYMETARGGGGRVDKLAASMGMLATCLGDSAAGIVGSMFSLHRRRILPCSQGLKTVQGSVAFVLLFCFGCAVTRFIRGERILLQPRDIAAALASAGMEGYTDDIDNFQTSLAAYAAYNILE